MSDTLMVYVNFGNHSERLPDGVTLTLKFKMSDYPLVSQ